MAHYRNLHVNNRVYRYNIGKKYIILRTDGTKEYIEKTNIQFAQGTPITPAMLSDYLRGTFGDISKYFTTCKHETKKTLHHNPFLKEIYGKKLWIYVCDDCFQKLTEEI